MKRTSNAAADRWYCASVAVRRLRRLFQGFPGERPHRFDRQARGIGRGGPGHLRRGRGDHVTDVRDADHARRFASALGFLIEHRRHPDQRAVHGKDRSTRAAGRQHQVGEDGVRAGAHHQRRRQVLLLADRRADREDALAVGDGGLRRVGASQRHRLHRGRRLGVHPQDGDVARRVGDQNRGRDLHHRAELHLDGCRRTDGTLARRDQAAAVEHEPRCSRCRRPQPDNAVLPLHQD